MKTIFALAPLALGLAACQSYPPGGPTPSAPGPSYRAIGTEPFWSLDIGRTMTFTDRGSGTQVTEPMPTPIHGIAGEIYNAPRINANIVHARCTDGMSERSYPDTVQVRVDGREYKGCGAAIGFYERGEGPPGTDAAAHAFAGTNWRVTGINGRPTPSAGYTMSFTPDRISAKFGCNGLGASYRVAGDLLTAGAVMATRMACPDMSGETQGGAILARPMRIIESGDRVSLANTAGSIDLQRVR